MAASMDQIGPADASGTSSLIFGKGLNEVSGDVVFAPVDPSGEPGTLNRQILQRLGLSHTITPTQDALAPGYEIVSSPVGMVCFVVSVGPAQTFDILRRNLTAALQDRRLTGVRTMWLPLMGTGYGKLSYSASSQLTITVLRETGWLDRSTRIILAGPEGLDPSPDWLPPPVSSDPDTELIDAVPPELAGHDDEAGPNNDAGDEEGGESPSSPDDLQNRLSPPVVAAMAFAESLGAGRKEEDRTLSTTLLFYALAESPSAAAPHELRSEFSAELFAGAVRSLAGGRFQQAWDDYFASGYRPSAPTDPNQQPLRRTISIEQVLRQAISFSVAGNRPAATLEDLIISLLSYPKGLHHLTLEKMGVRTLDLLAAFQDALIGRIGTTLLSDVASSDDRLGYKRYASAITSFLLDATSPPPLSVSIQAPWGAGKSSLMHQIREQLDPKDTRDKYRASFGDTPARLLVRDVLSFLNRKGEKAEEHSAIDGHLWTVWFNAWKYDTAEQVWAGLVDAIVGQVSGRLPRAEREKFLLKLQLARIDDGVVRKKIYDRVVTIWWAQARKWVLAGVALAATLFSAHRAVESFKLSAQDSAFYKAVEWSPYGPLILLALYLATSYFNSRHETRSEPASFSLAEYLKVPNYDLTLSTIHHIHEDLLRVLRSTPVQIVDGRKLPSPLVIFIDDLDRCSPSKVAAVVEGVSMFLASDEYRCMFVIGMDPQMIAAALEDAHAKVRDQLPRYERTVPLGWRFMDKFIQLPFTIPPSDQMALERFVSWLTGRADPEATKPAAESIPPEPNVPPSATPSTENPDDRLWTMQFESEDTKGPRPNTPTSSPVAKAQIAFKESQEVGRIIQEAAKNTSGNPREIKRLANLTRLYLALRNKRRELDPLWRSPAVSQYARWIVLTLRWPDMLRWLQWGADEVTWRESDKTVNLAARRLRILEDAAEACATAESWTGALVINLSVPGDDESDWAADPKLFEFFRNEVTLAPEARLSAAAKAGFW